MIDINLFIKKNTIIFLIYFLLFNFIHGKEIRYKATLFSDKEAKEWIVLPEKLHLYFQPDEHSGKSDIQLKFSKEVREISRISSPEEGGISWIKIMHEQDEYYLPVVMLVRKNSWEEKKGNLIVGQEKIDKDRPLSLDYKPNDLVLISQRWNYHPQEYSKYIRKQAAQELIRMLKAAEDQNIHLRVVSAYRSADSQRNL